MEIAEIVCKQRKFFGSHATKPLEFRKAQLRKLRSAIEENKTAILDAVFNDLRRPHQLTEQIEMSTLYAEIDNTLENLEEWMKPEEHSEHLFGKPMIYKDPLGVALVFGPFNFPVMLSLRPAICAIGAGNTVIIKPSEITEHSTALLRTLIHNCFPPEFVAIVEGGPEVCKELLKQRFDHIFYTGCPRIGKIVMAAASNYLTSVTLELGGQNATIVEPDVDFKFVAKKIVFGRWANCGQSCLSPEYVLIRENMVEKFVEEVKSELVVQFGEHPKASPNYSRMVNQFHSQRVQKLLDNSNGQILYNSLDENDVESRFIGPYVIKVGLDDVLLEDEIFGPILLIVTVKDFDETLEIIQRREKCLSMYIFTNDEKKVERLLENTSSGAVIVNDCVKHFAVRTLPFGGIGNSGLGAYHGKFGFDTFSHRKAVLKAHNK